MPAPRRFSEEQLRTTALGLVDERGLAALTMRSLAAALGTGPMTIYNYLDGRQGLERLVVDAVLAEVRPRGVPSADWRADVGELAEAFWRALRAHPHAVPLVVSVPMPELGGTSLELADTLVQALARSGRTGASLLAAFRAVTGYVLGCAQSAGVPGPEAAPDRAAGSLSAPSRGDGAEAVRARFWDVPADRFPHLAAIGAMAGADPDEEFRAGLAVVLDGLG